MFIRAILQYLQASCILWSVP